MACKGEPKPVAVSVSTVVVTATAAPVVVATTPVATATATAAPAKAAVPAVCGEQAAAPTSGRWIEVDVTHFMVRLMDGSKTVQEVGPVGVGAQVNTCAYESTQTGLFHVYQKTAERTYDAPYNTYIEWWVGFDTEKANGFHSFLEDAQGKVVDGSTGRISNGCIRSGQAQMIYQFAEIGMPVWVHV